MTGSMVGLLRARMTTFLGLVALGVAGYGVLHYASASPERRPPQDRGRPVRVLEVAALDATPRVTGYGVVEAQRSWQAIAEVGGTIIELGPDVEVGRTVQAGALLFRIDPGSYELERTRSEASVQGVQAQIGELKARESSAQASLELDRKVLELAREDLERARQGNESGLVSDVNLEAAERAVLAAEKTVLGLENTLLELPASRRVLEAQIAQQQAGVEGARLQVAKTEIVAPFTMRIRQLTASLHQAVGSGQVVLVGDGIDVMEVRAQMPVGTIGPLLRPRSDDADAGAPEGQRQARARLPSRTREREGPPVPAPIRRGANRTAGHPAKAAPPPRPSHRHRPAVAAPRASLR